MRIIDEVKHKVMLNTLMCLMLDIKLMKSPPATITFKQGPILYIGPCLVNITKERTATILAGMNYDIRASTSLCKLPKAGPK